MSFYPPPLPVPNELRTDSFFLQPLTPAHTELDYAALMDSKTMLRDWSNSSWVRDDFSLAENAQDLARHEAEQQRREAFAYTVLNPVATVCLGCVYLQPLEQLTQQLQSSGQSSDGQRLVDEVGDACVISFWIRQTYLVHNLDQILLHTLRRWLTESWQFERSLFLASQHEHRQIQLFQAAGLKPVETLNPKWQLFRE